MEQSVIDNAVDQRHRRVHTCIRAGRGLFEYSAWQQ